MLFGSSPRVRGTHRPIASGIGWFRFIPACAGNTTAICPAELMPTVHPRVCGEHNQGPLGKPRIGGSSPRVRGTPHHSNGHPPHPRFIPACAGNTTSRTRTIFGQPVHPRVCGEHVHAVHKLGPDFGSSPRVRGTRARQRRHRRLGRFIPACAGNTPSATGRNIPAPVHPRVCGEHVQCHGISFPVDGSSPRVRGTLLERGSDTDVRRFIPACAGNTARARKRYRRAAVHPRVCGEHRGERATSDEQTGSSPRVRGTRRGRRPAARATRFIPACAGNTPC